jgi:hypothetical protein
MATLQARRRGASLLLAAAAWLTIGNASAQSLETVPLEFKGITVGLPPPDEGVFKRLVCRAQPGSTSLCVSPWDNSRPSGIPHETIAGAPIDLLFVVVRDGAVESIVIMFPPSKFSEVRDTVRGKYTTVKCADSTVSNAMGAQFDQQTCVAKTTDALLALNKRSNKLSESTLTMTADSVLTRERAQRKANSKDL